MECPACGAEVPENQRFCHECGSTLHGVTEPTQELAEMLSDTADGSDTADEPVDETTAPTGQPDDEPADQPTDGPVDARWEAPSPIIPRDEAITTEVDVGGGDRLTTPPSGAPADQANITVRGDVDEFRFDGVSSSDDAGPVETFAVDDPAAVTSPDHTGSADTVPIDTVPVEAQPGGVASSTAEMPIVFDGLDDLADYPAAREPFRFKLVFLLALFGAIALVMSAVADITEILTTRPAGIANGVSTLDTFGTNLAVAGYVGATVMVLGGLAACFGLRWGAGLAGGAGLALLGWAMLTIGLVEYPIAVAESITRTSTEVFTLKVTRDVGWWLIAGVGIVGLLVFAASLRSIGTGRRAGLNPWIAAVTAVSLLVLAAGPTIPVGNATFRDNFRSPTANIDLPTAYFAGRIGQLGLIALAGVVGMLLVRAYGLGFAAGGLSVAVWMWISSLGEFGTLPVGIADHNPGALDTVPHGVTTVGMVLSLLFLIVAAALAIIQHRHVSRWMAARHEPVAGHEAPT